MSNTSTTANSLTNVADNLETAMTKQIVIAPFLRGHAAI